MVHSPALSLSSKVSVPLSTSQPVAHTNLCVCVSGGWWLFKKSLVQPDKCDLYSSLRIYVRVASLCAGSDIETRFSQIST